LSTVRPRRPLGDVGVVVHGEAGELTDLLIKLARCCTPVPGDEILGFVTRGGGVSVHRLDCTNAADLRKRDAAPGLRLGVELLIPDWSRFAHARILGQSCWGSTSTTAVTPARRIAGAAAASSAAARDASARGRSVLPTS